MIRYLVVRGFASSARSHAACATRSSGVSESLSGEAKAEGYAIFTDLMNAVRHGKSHGYVPDGKFTGMYAKPLMGDDDLFASLDEEPSALMEDLLRKAAIESITQSFAGSLDFDDQILMPTVFQASFDAFPLTLVDETQDLSELNHVMLRKIVRTKRLIAVGDSNQSIYAFRGAHENSMELMREAFEMERLDLSISFRCPQAVIREARFRAPAMAWPEWAIEGEVSYVSEWSAESVAPTATILCRNNAPLFNNAIRLLRNGRYPELVGNDIGKGLVKIMKKLGDPKVSSEDAVALIEDWKEKKLLKSRNPGGVYDQAECMLIFLEQGPTLGDAIAYAEHLLSVSGGIKMMTIHKSKGLEWPHVYILDKQLIRVDKSGQEKNLLYVAQTRAKETLTYITSEGFKGV